MSRFYAYHNIHNEADLLDMYLKMHVLRKLHALSEASGSNTFFLTIQQLNEWIPMPFDVQTGLRFLQSFEYVPSFPHFLVTERKEDATTFRIEAVDTKKQCYSLRLSDRLPAFLTQNAEAIEKRVAFSFDFWNRYKEKVCPSKPYQQSTLHLKDCLYYHDIIEIYGKRLFQGHLFLPLRRVAEANFGKKCTIK